MDIKKRGGNVYLMELDYVEFTLLKICVNDLLMAFRRAPYRDTAFLTTKELLQEVHDQLEKA